MVTSIFMSYSFGLALFFALSCYENTFFTLPRRILVLFILLCSSIIVYAQKASLMAKVMSADKIEILSHQDLYLRSTIDELNRGVGGYWRNIVDSNGQLNSCIVAERLELNVIEVNSLVSILCSKYNSEIPSDRASCFNPHQTILFYKNSKYSYIDICFDCQRFSSSNDIIISRDFLSTEEQWDKLKNFFISSNIIRKIELKTK